MEQSILENGLMDLSMEKENKLKIGGSTLILELGIEDGEKGGGRFITIAKSNMMANLTKELKKVKEESG
jgi:hypothetical protein